MVKYWLVYKNNGVYGGVFMGLFKKLIVLLVLLSLVGTVIFFGSKFFLINKLDDKYHSTEYKLALIELKELELASSKIEVETSTKIEDKNIKFAIPLKDGNITSLSSGSIKVDFDDKKMVVYLGTSNTYSEELTKDLKASDVENLKKYFKKDSISSEYEYLKAIFNCTPRDISLSSSFNKIKAYNSSLLVKNTLLPNFTKEMCYFETDKFKGFMYSGDNNISLDIYSDESTRHSILLANITIEEAKHILSSIEFN